MASSKIQLIKVKSDDEKAIDNAFLGMQCGLPNDITLLQHQFDLLRNYIEYPDLLYSFIFDGDENREADGTCWFTACSYLLERIRKQINAASDFCESSEMHYQKAKKK